MLRLSICTKHQGIKSLIIKCLYNLVIAPDFKIYFYRRIVLCNFINGGKSWIPVHS